MIRLTWLQFRTQAVTAAAALAAFAVLLAATGPHLASMSAVDGLSSCHGGSCQNLAQNFIVQITGAGPCPTLYLIRGRPQSGRPLAQSRIPRITSHPKGARPPRPSQHETQLTPTGKSPTRPTAH
jgi:hypothetical protein